VYLDLDLDLDPVQSGFIRGPTTRYDRQRLAHTNPACPVKSHCKIHLQRKHWLVLDPWSRKIPENYGTYM
jgi:hypothetical protein